MKASKFVAMVVAVGCLAGVASALQVATVQVGPGFGPYQTGSGGEFTLTVIGGSLDLSGYCDAAAGYGYGLNNETSFQTFCLEGSERIYQNQIMTAVQSDRAIWGSVGPNGDYISVGTGWLYMQFASGIWATGLSYDYTNPGRSTNPAGSGYTGASAYLLQQAIWCLEQENYNTTLITGNMYYNAVLAEFGSLANARYGDASQNGATEYGVYALNMTYNDLRRQDQLYFDGSHRVPDGGMTLALTGLALAGLAVLRRRLL